MKEQTGSIEKETKLVVLTGSKMTGLPVVIVSTGCDSLWSLAGKLSTTTNTFPRAVPTQRQGLTKLSAKYNSNSTV